MNDDNTVLKLLSILIIGLFLSLWQRVTRKFRVETGRRCMPRKANMQNNFEFSSPSLKFRWLMFLLKISTLMPWSVTFAENKFSLINTYRWRGVCEVCLPKRLLSMRATSLMCGPLFVWPASDADCLLCTNCSDRRSPTDVKKFGDYARCTRPHGDQSLKLRNLNIFINTRLYFWPTPPTVGTDVVAWTSVTPKYFLRWSLIHGECRHR